LHKTTSLIAFRSQLKIQPNNFKDISREVGNASALQKINSKPINETDLRP